MKINLKFHNPQITTETEIQEIETLTKLQFSEELKDFFLKYNGAELTFIHSRTENKINTFTCLFTLEYEESKCEEIIMKIQLLSEVKKTWAYIGYLQDFVILSNLSSDYVEVDKLFPIMESLSGGTIYIAFGGRHNGKIYFVDTRNYGILLQTNSLTKFLEKLQQIEE